MIRITFFLLYRIYSLNIKPNQFKLSSFPKEPLTFELIFNNFKIDGLTNEVKHIIFNYHHLIIHLIIHLTINI